MASRVKIRTCMEARSCNFRTVTNFGKERLRVLRGPICPQIFPKWQIISAKTARNLPKLHESCAPLRQKLRGCEKRESCAKVALHNIAIFWWDYKGHFRLCLRLVIITSVFLLQLKLKPNKALDKNSSFNYGARNESVQ